MKLPPLNALRCFEAAARLLSLKLAASELCVTPSAVSQQIARLEETLNVPLFIRTPRRLQLTAVGEIYLRAVQPAFHQIAAATQRLQVPRDQKGSYQLYQRLRHSVAAAAAG
nr:Gcv operon activator [Klebsiella pneumoniae]